MQDGSPQSSARAVIIYAILIVAVIAAIALLLASRPQPVSITVNPPPPTGTPAPTLTPSPITVYITGAVAQSGITITLPYASRVEEALAAAGGALPEADLERINLAAFLRDGDQVHVPLQGEGDTVLATPSGGQLVRINTATLEEIDTLPGIGPALAERIIAYREANGTFASLDDLDQVEGIGPDLLAEIAVLVVFD
jgi:competence protein ComEA